LLGQFSITAGAKTAGPWARPPARRLLELLFISPGRRIGRAAACGTLFPHLGPAAAARELSKALSMARTALSPLGKEAAGLIQTDRAHVWADPGIPLEVDMELQQERLRSALNTEPGIERDDQLVRALVDEGTLLEDEPVAEWAVRPRERLEWDRQEARLALARDRSRGRGRSQPEAVIEAWTGCLAHDPTSEEAASALMRVYGAQRRHTLVKTTYERCRTALEDLGLRISPALTEVYTATGATEFPQQPEDPLPPTPLRYREERRLVSVLFAELSGPVGVGARLDPEDLRQVVGATLATLIAEVEALGGVVTSVSGAGLAALFGAPEAHEDDPERAVRAGSRILSAIGTGGRPPRPGELSARVGIETGPAVVGPLGVGGGYGAMGEVVSDAAAVQSAAKAGSVLVGPVTRTATDGAFDWGSTEDVSPGPGAKPLVSSYVERPKARPPGYRGHARLAGRAPLVGRHAELALLDDALDEAVSGAGSVVFLVGEPGLGKTRLVHECRKRFMAWVGARTGRLPLWLEGRCASYASSTPYGLYQQLLFAWTGAVPEEGEDALRSGLERAMKAIFGGQVDYAGLLAHMMGLRAGPDEARLGGLSPEGLQRATFAALKAVVARLAEKGPTVLVLEDLHWANPISVRLTEELAALTRDGPLLLLATRRPEPDPGVSGLESALEAEEECAVLRVDLSPLPQEAERALAGSLIGPGVSEAVIEVACAGVDGNPLFLEERLSSLVETSALVKDGIIWRLNESESAQVPEVLERLIRSRVDRLGPLNREIITSASVIGREFGLSSLAAAAEIEGDLGAALGELCTTGLLAGVRQLPEPTYRFRHAIIQDAIYRGLLRGQRRQLHARAAWGLEAASADRLHEVAAILGHHYVAAGETDRAAYYFEVAGDHAASLFATNEAVSSYRRALAIVAQERADEAIPKAAVEVRSKLAEVLWRTGRHGEARDALEEALGLVGLQGSLQAAHLQVRLGRVEMADHQYDAAMAAFDAADGLLGEYSEDYDDETVDLWLEVQLAGRAYLHYWRNETEAAGKVLARARPVVERRGTPARRQSFYTGLTAQRSRQARYRIDAGMIADARTALLTAEPGVGEHDVAWAQFNLGFTLLWHGDLAEAQEKLEASLAIVNRVGDVVLKARCLCYLHLVALRRQDVDAVRSLTPQVLVAAEAAGYPEYVAAAKATMAWVAWRDERVEDVLVLAKEALDLWGTVVTTYPFKWSCLWPLIAVHLAAGQVVEAVDASRRLLIPTQLHLPDELEALLESAQAAWTAGEGERSADKLAEALELARRLRFA
jgi:class 3 adenylate cyclase/tetratricopeptide (TPR) repeat protein